MIETGIFQGLSSSLSESVKASRAALEAEYGARYGWGMMPAIEPMFTMRPCPLPDKGQKCLGDGDVPNEVDLQQVADFSDGKKLQQAACCNNACIINQPGKTGAAHLAGDELQSGIDGF